VEQGRSGGGLGGHSGVSNQQLVGEIGSGCNGVVARAELIVVRSGAKLGHWAREGGRGCSRTEVAGEDTATAERRFGASSAAGRRCELAETKTEGVRRCSGAVASGRGRNDVRLTVEEASRMEVAEEGQ